MHMRLSIKLIKTLQNKKHSMPKLQQDQSIYFTFNPVDVPARVCKHVAFSRNMLRPEACTKKHFEIHLLRKRKKEKACSGIKKFPATNLEKFS